MSNQQTGRVACVCRQAQPARRRQGHLIEDAGGQTQALRFQTVFECDQGFAGARGLDKQDAGGIKSEMSETRKRWPAQFISQRARPAPHQPRSAGRVFKLQGIKTANGEAQRKPERRHPICRRGTRLRSFSMRSSPGLRTSRLHCRLGSI